MGNQTAPCARHIQFPYTSTKLTCSNAGPYHYPRDHHRPDLPRQADRWYQTPALFLSHSSHEGTCPINSAEPLLMILRPSYVTAEDNMNIQLRDITVTARDGRVSHLDQVYIRGSHVRFFIVPDMLRNAPMFRSRNVRGRGVGLARGRATVNRARGGGGRGGRGDR